MPNLVHEVIITEVAALINTKLRALCQQSSTNQGTRTLLDGLRSYGGADILLENGNKRCPDQQWRISNEKYPCIVLEVGNSQTAENLNLVADDWIVESEECVRMVVTVKFEYNEKNNVFGHRQLVVYRTHTDEENYLMSKVVLSIEVSMCFTAINHDYGEQWTKQASVNKPRTNPRILPHPYLRSRPTISPSATIPRPPSRSLHRSTVQRGSTMLRSRPCPPRSSQGAVRTTCAEEEAEESTGESREADGSR